MKLVTFGGNFCHFPLMEYDVVVVDDSYSQCLDRVSHANDRTTIIHVQSGRVGDSMEDRRWRIAYLVKVAVESVQDDVLLLDSDVYVPRLDPNMFASRRVFSLCIPARAKPSNNVIVFCFGTNLYIPSSYRVFVSKVLQEYLDRNLVNQYVDIYLTSRLIPMTLVVGGVRHYVSLDDHEECWELSPSGIAVRCS